MKGFEKYFTIFFPFIIFFIVAKRHMCVVGFVILYKSTIQPEPYQRINLSFSLVWNVNYEIWNSSHYRLVLFLFLNFERVCSLIFFSKLIIIIKIYQQSLKKITLYVQEGKANSAMRQIYLLLTEIRLTKVTKEEKNWWVVQVKKDLDFH